jgi:hypothetical protein
VSLDLENGNSVHLGNDARVLFGDRVVLQINDFETQANTPIRASVDGVASGGDISLQWRPGLDRITSSGGFVSAFCNLIVVEPPPPDTSTIPPDTTTTTQPPVVTTTQPPTATTTTSLPPSTTVVVPPPTLIESGDAGYLGEEDDGHEHEGTDGGLLIAMFLIGFGAGGIVVASINAWVEGRE